MRIAPMWAGGLGEGIEAEPGERRTPGDVHERRRVRRGSKAAVSVRATGAGRRRTGGGVGAGVQGRGTPSYRPRAGCPPSALPATPGSATIGRQVRPAAGVGLIIALL